MKSLILAIAIRSAYRPFFGPEQERAAERIQRVMLYRSAYEARLAKVRAAFTHKLRETMP